MLSTVTSYHIPIFSATGGKTGKSGGKSVDKRGGMVIIFYIIVPNTTQRYTTKDVRK